MKNKTLSLCLILLLCGFPVYANNIINKKLNEQSKESSQKYVTSSSNKQFNPDSQKADADTLGHSVEFEVFKINEDGTSHTTFKSNAGICYGFKQGDGVQVTDAATYYLVKNSQEEYYLNIADAEIAQGKVVREMKYAPVFNVNDQRALKTLKEENEKLGGKLAEKNIVERSKILSNVVCK